MISAVIPAYNEGERIGGVVGKALDYVDEVVVVDDCSSDETRAVAREAGARVIRNEANIGYIYSIKKGFREAKGDIIVTLDGDGEHDPAYIPKLVKPITDGEADLVFGVRAHITRLSERLLNQIVNLKVKVLDSGTGFRALKKELAVKLELRGECTCGILLLESLRHGAVFREIPVYNRQINKKRAIAWGHLKQFFYLLYELSKG
ncbi:MAG: glycosyltransferase [Candidatus Altiarchaeales archaeon ex4484_96]|nr:MAG: glycosyltransferase [Candidatus Altiarchaeales archaeon ex4484_96]